MGEIPRRLRWLGMTHFVLMLVLDTETEAIEVNPYLGTA